jgi:branched-chain amino acid transport system ATP-binding protein
MLEVNEIYSGYGKIEILHGISLRAKRNEIVSIIGPNGAGKTTILKTIFGVLTAKKGTIKFKGKDVTNYPPDKIVKMGMALVPQGRAVFPSLTVLENLEMGVFTRDDKQKIKEDLETVFEKFPILKERKHQLGGSMSGGEQQMLAIGRGLMLNPDLLMLDEPSLGLAPKIVETIMNKIVEINESGTTVVMVEQNAKVALEIADRCYVIETGMTKLEGKGSDLLNDETVRKIYLGGV